MEFRTAWADYLGGTRRRAPGRPVAGAAPAAVPAARPAGGRRLAGAWGRLAGAAARALRIPGRGQGR